jgi:hypothetical protein
MTSFTLLLLTTLRLYLARPPRNESISYWLGGIGAPIDPFLLIILMNCSSGRKIFGRTTGTSDTASRSGSSISKMAAQRAAREGAGRVAPVAPPAAQL